MGLACETPINFYAHHHHLLHGWSRLQLENPDRGAGIKKKIQYGKTWFYILGFIKYLPKTHICRE